jgi:glycosyltransferase involved in cell wall biosynthesis
MKAVWVTRSFLDYRIPVYEDVSRRLDDRFVLFFNADYVPDRCCLKVRKALGHRARGLHGELTIRFGSQNGFANRGIRIPYQRDLVRAILEEKPDVLISDGFFQWTYSALWLRATRRVPHVMCYEGTAHTERDAQWYRNTYRRWVTRWIDAVCCNGTLCGQYMRTMGFPTRRMTYGHMVADVDGFQRSADTVTNAEIAGVRADYDLKGIVFLYVGRLIPLKGVSELLAAWSQFSPPHVGGAKHEATLLLVGGGPQKNELEQRCRSHGLTNVRFAGTIDYNRLALYYKCAHIFVMPTLEDKWSLVVPEAMACGLPILCSKYNGCWPELVKADNGWVFDPLDIQDTLEVLRRCVGSRAKMAEMAKASRAIVNNHTATHAADAILNACRLALARPTYERGWATNEAGGTTD